MRIILATASATGRNSCAAAGMISIHFGVNVVGKRDGRPVPCGKDSHFGGTNPLCVVFPRAGHPPLLLDYATSAIAFGSKTRVAAA